MKKFFLIVSVFVLLIISSIAQETRQYKNAVYVSVGAFMVSQKNYYKPITEVRPAVSVQYNRVLWKGLGISAGYAFKRANPNAHYITGESITCTEQTNAILITPNYYFEIKNFNITPFFSMGVCFTNFIFPVRVSPEEEIYRNVRSKIYPCFMISPGIRIGYDISRWNIFISYNFDYYRGDFEPPFSVLATWTFPKNFGHHCFNIGAGIKF